MSIINTSSASNIENSIGTEKFSAAQRKRHARLAAIFLLVLAFATGVFNLYQGLRFGILQNLTIGGITLALMFVIAESMLALKKRATETVVWTIVISAWVALLGHALLFAGLGIALGGFGLLVTALIGAFSLPQARVERIIIGSAVAAFITYLPDSFTIPFRYATPSSAQLYLWIIAIVSILSYGILLWVQFPTYPVRGKLTIALTTSAAMATFVVGGYFIYLNYTSLGTQFAEQQLNNLALHAAKIDNASTTIQNEINVLREVEAIPEYLKMLEGGATAEEIADERAHIAKEYLSFAQSHPNYARIRFIDPQGQEIAQVYTDLQGVAQATPLDDLENVSTLAYFIASSTLSSNQIYLSDFTLDTKDGQVITPYTPIIRYSTPITSGATTYGIVVVDIYADDLLETLQNADTPTFLVDAGGYFVYHPDQEKRWGRALANGITVKTEFGNIAQIVLAKDAGTQRTTENIYAYQPITLAHDDGEQRWHLFNALLTEEANAPIRQSINIGIAILFATLLVITAIAATISRGLSRPLKQLTEAAQRIASGSLDIETQIASDDEIGQLAHSFNSMAMQIQQLVEGLEQSIADRTVDLEKRTTQLHAAAVVGHAAASIRDLNELLTQAVDLVSASFNVYHVGIFLIDNQHEYAVLGAANSFGGKRMLQSGYKLSLNQDNIVGHVIESALPRITLDTGEQAAQFEYLDLANTRSEITLPLAAGGQTLGALDIHSTEAEAFSKDDIEVFQVLADQIAVAIQNALSFTQIEDALEASRRAYGEISRAGWQEKLSTAPNWGYHFAARKKGAQSTLTPVEGDWKTEADLAARTGQIVPYNDNHALAVPIKTRGEVIGVINVQKSPEEGTWTSDDKADIQSLAEQLGQAMESARLYEDTQRRAETERIVAEITDRMRGTMNIETVIRTAAEDIYDVLDLDHVTIRLIEADDPGEESN